MGLSAFNRVREQRAREAAIADKEAQKKQAAKEKADKAAAGAASRLIAAIDTENLDAVSVVGARVSYNALTADQTALVDNADKLAQAEKDLLKRVRRRQMLAMRRIDRNLALEKNTWFHTASNASEQLYYCLKRLCEPCKEHVGNNFNPMPKVYLREFLPIRTRIFNLMVEIRRMMEQNDYSDIENVLIEAEGLRESISTERKTQMYRVQEEGNSLHVSLVYLITLQESQELVDTLRQLLKACNKFTK